MITTRDAILLLSIYAVIVLLVFIGAYTVVRWAI